MSSRRLTLAFGLLLLASVGLAQSSLPAAQPVLIAPEARVVDPGTFVVLPFFAGGEGEATIEVHLPSPDWSTTSDGRLVSLGAETRPLPITLMVPASAPAGTIGTVTVRLRRDGRALADSSVRVTVAERVSFDLSLAARIRLAELRDADLELVLTSRSNVDDVIRLSSDDPEISFGSTSIPLAAGAVERVPVRFLTPTDARLGQRFLVTIRARSQLRPDLEETRRTSIRFESDQSASGPPTLRAALRLTSGVAASFGDSGATVGASLGAKASLSGRLSDFVGANIELGDLAVSTRGVRPPSTAELALEGDTWLGGIRYGASGIDGQAAWSGERVSVRGQARSDLGRNSYARFGARLRDPLPDIALEATVVTDDERHVETLSVRYRLPLDAWQIGLGVALEGRGTEEGGYEVTPRLRQSVATGGQRWYVQQTLDVAPLEDRWGIGVTAGTRSQRPVGVQIASRFDAESADRRIAATGTLTLAALDPLVLTGRAGYEATTGENVSGLYRLGIQSRLSGRLGGLNAGWGVRYRATRPTYGDVAREDAYETSIRARFGALELDARGGYRGASATLEDAPVEAWTASAVLRARSGVATELEAQVAYEHEAIARSYDVKYDLAWDQRWSRTVNTSFTLARSEVSDGIATPSVVDSLQARLTWSDAFGVDASELQLGYAVSFDGGVFAPAPSAVHVLNVQYSVSLGTDVRTPDAVVDAFGGRYGGTVSGRVYVDQNSNAAYDDGEPVVKGTLVAFDADTTARTGDDGRFLVAVPEGTYDRVTVGGLPSGLGMVDDLRLQVVRNRTYRLDVRVAPVRSIRITLFEDLDRDGERDAGEAPMIGVGVISDGPVRRSAVTSPDGIAFVPNLLTGSYRFYLDPDRSPERFEPTGDATLDIVAPGGPVELSMGVAERPRRTVTTFTPGTLALFVQAEPSRVRPGERIEFTARTEGNPDRVTIELLGETIQLVVDRPGSWHGNWTVPEDQQAGRIEAIARAEVDGARTETRFPITIREP